jgi:ABC-type multidrug transport system ATPase subunit
LLRFENISKKYASGQLALENLSLHLDYGVVGLLGPNGAGKSTMLRLAATLEKPTSGKILFNNKNIVQNPDAIRAYLGYLPQDFNVEPTLTGVEFPTYIASLKGLSGSACAKEVDEALATTNLTSISKRRISTFSGGMIQRLGIAQALIGKPTLLLADEPTSGLDPEERLMFRNLLSTFGRTRLAVLSTHIVSDIEMIATQVAIMHMGKLIDFDTPQRLTEHARGAVWQIQFAYDEFARVENTYRSSSQFRLSRIVSKADSVCVTVLSNIKPLSDAIPEEPQLEDAYLCLLHNII